MKNSSVPKLARGFALLTPAERSRIASMGGKEAHRIGRAHQFTSAEAIEAGKKRRKRKG